METALTPADLDNRFKHHTPTQSKIMKHEVVRARCRDLATTLVDVCPPSRECNKAIEHLEEVMMWSNAAIARHNRPAIESCCCRREE